MKPSRFARRQRISIRSTRIIIAFAFLLAPNMPIGAGSGTASPSLSNYLEQAKAQDATPEGRRYTAAVSAPLRAAWHAAFNRCRDPHRTLSKFSFQVVLVLQASGRVSAVFQSPNTALMRCAAAELAARQWPVPPHDGWVIRLAGNFSPT